MTIPYRREANQGEMLHGPVIEGGGGVKVVRISDYP
jgi:hypothetical protein